MTDIKLIAKCGLYCGSCAKYKSTKCPGCSDNVRATWCKIRSCNLENNYLSCADCMEFANPNDCKKFNNLISKVFAFVFKSDRPACIASIKDMGYESFAAYMDKNGWQSIKRA
jgi:hypothetical protein